MGRSLEWRRVVALPRRATDFGKTPDLTPIWLRTDSTCEGCDLCQPGPVKLRALQSFALLEAERAGGLFGSIGVGEGKELLCLLLPDAMDAKRAVILTEPRLKSQMLEVDIPRYRRHFELPLDRITVVAYSELSGTDSGDVLERLNPDLVIANEAHNLRRKEAARTKRFHRYLEEHRPRFVPLSGSFMEDDPADYADLLAAALPGAEPFPRGCRERNDWSRGLSVKGDVRPGALLDLCGPGDLADEIDKLPIEDQTVVAFGQPRGREVERELARRIFARRLAETPGVVRSAGTEVVGASLVITARRVEVPDVVRKALDRVEELWRVEDEDLEDAMAVARVRREMACGFYYRWAWPSGVRDEEWLVARAAWFATVRHVLRYQAGPGLDSPKWVERAAEANELRGDQLAAWEAWKAVKDRWTPHPPTEAVWLSDFFVEDCLAWLGEQTLDAPAILWCEHRALMDALRDRGAAVFGGGKQGDEILTFDGPACVASMAHAVGKNLQRWFSRNRVTTAPSSRIAWQQLLGRTHRPGQRAGEVEVWVDYHDDSLQRAFATALASARAAEQQGEGHQKLVYATKIGF